MEMLQAFGIGLAAQLSLLLAGIVVCWITVPRRTVGILAGFGAGAMVAAISFDLVVEAEGLESWELGLLMLVGAAVFLAGDRLVERRFGGGGGGGGGDGTPEGDGAQEDGEDEGQAMGIVVGSVVDGVPESIILGIQVAAGIPLSFSFVAAVFVSNIPQAIAPSADLAADGWGPRRLGRLWCAVVLACAVAAAIGYAAADLSSSVTGAGMAAFAAGGLLAMLTDSLIPFAYERGGQLAGVATVVGFCLSLLGS